MIRRLEFIALKTCVSISIFMVAATGILLNGVRTVFLKREIVQPKGGYAAGTTSNMDTLVSILNEHAIVRQPN